MSQKDLGVQEPIIRRKYHTLDGIRGAAALMILVRHAGYYFGEIGTQLSKAESYLAVDLFFVLSGFVIAEAYDRRLSNGLSPMDFMKIRFIRLYPLYLLGLVIGTIAAIFSIFGNNTVSLTGGSLAKDFAFCLFMFPSPFSTTLYPINLPSWSIFFELISNGLYAFSYSLLTTGKMIFTILIAALGLGFCAFQNGHTDGGGDWSGFLIGLLRVVYSFGAGLLIQRHHREIRTLALPSWILIIFVIALLSFTPSNQVRPWYDMIVVILLFPAIVHIAAASESSSDRVIKIYSLLGTTSYAIYILHDRFASFIAAAFRRELKHEVSQFAPLSGLIFTFGLVSVCWLLDSVYDLPIRRWATTIFLPKAKNPK